MTAQVTYFSMAKRLLGMTHLFQLSRLLYQQWQSNPALAIASLIINAYNRQSVLTAQNEDVALTIVGVTHLRFKKKVKTNTCPL